VLKDFGFALQKAEMLWLLSRNKVAVMGAADFTRRQAGQENEKLLAKAKQPKEFPISVDAMMHGLFPKMGRARRDKFNPVFARSFYHLFFPFKGAISKEEYERHLTDVFVRRFDKTIEEPLWKQFVIQFQTWYPAYLRDVRAEKARNAAASKHNKSGNSHLTEIPNPKLPKQP